MTWDDYGKGKLPPEWASRLERWFAVRKAWIWIVLFLLFFFVWPAFYDDPGPYLPPQEERKVIP